MIIATQAIERIEYAPACEVISLTSAERALYHGCGETIARFKHGVLVELYRPNPPYIEDGTAEDSAEYCARAAIRYRHEHITDECMLVMCSGYQLCSPEPFSHNDYAMLFDRFLTEFEGIYA